MLSRQVASLLVLPSFAAFGPGGAAPRAQGPRTASLVIVVDGLRPDYVTPDVMPRLSALGRRGTVFADHHAVFPTVTRVNASSFVTGAYPETHGLLGNAIYIPSVSRDRAIDTGVEANLEAVAAAEGRLLTAPGLGEILHAAGQRLLVVSSGSSGSALLLNHRNGDGVVVHPEFTRPRGFIPPAALGPPPAKAMPNDPQNRYAIDAYLALGLGADRPEVTWMWLNDPDGTAHAKGIGAEMSRQSLSLVDAGVGRIEDTLRTRGLLERTNIIVTSDHGFSTHTGELRLAQILEPFVGTMPDQSKDIAVAEGAIYLRAGHDPARLAAIVAALQRRPEVGAIFTRPRPDGGPEGVVPGTLSFDVARWSHARSGDILVSANWSDAANAAGYKGQTTQGGVAGHGTSSPWDIHNTLIAAGPDFTERAVVSVPTGNVDIAPTLLHLLRVPAPASMSGRVLHEALRGGPAPASLRVERTTRSVRDEGGHYELTAHLSSVAGRTYLDYTEVRRR